MIDTGSFKKVLELSHASIDGDDPRATRSFIGVTNEASIVAAARRAARRL
jgi:hypothetical protein